MEVFSSYFFSCRLCFKQKYQRGCHRDLLTLKSGLRPIKKHPVCKVVQLIQKRKCIAYLVNVERTAIGIEVSVTVRGFEEGHKQHLSTPPRSISYIYYSPITLQPPLLFTSYSSNVATSSSLDGLSLTFQG